MSRSEAERALLHGRFPRVSGDEPVNVGFIWSDMLFSPRERG